MCGRFARAIDKRRALIETHQINTVKLIFIIMSTLLLFGCDSITRDRETIKGLNTIKAFQEFINKHPDNEHVSQSIYHFYDADTDQGR